MKMSYFEDTDTLHLELMPGQVSETRDLDENTLVDVDDSGHICSITFEHASSRTDLSQIQLEGLAA